jgi:hypothetical protein
MAGGFIDLVTLGDRASAGILLNTIADGTTAMLIILAMAIGLILPKMCIEHFYPPSPAAKFAKSRRNFYTQIERRSFYTTKTRSGHS